MVLCVASHIIIIIIIIIIVWIISVANNRYAMKQGANQKINAAFHWAGKFVFPNSYFGVGSRGARRIPSFSLGNTTSDFHGTIFPTGKLVNTSLVFEPNGKQHKSGYDK